MMPECDSRVTCRLAAPYLQKWPEDIESGLLHTNTEKDRERERVRRSETGTELPLATVAYTYILPP